MEKDIEERKIRIRNKFFSWVKDDYDRGFIVVLIFAFILRIWVFIITKGQAMWFDEAEYLSTAKYWAGVGSMNDIWYYRRGFFWPLFSSFFFRLGLGEMTIRFTAILFSTGTILISYFLIKDMFNKKYALFSCIGLSFSWVFLFFTGRPSTEIPAVFFLLLSLLCFWKGYELKQGNSFIYLFAFFLAISVLTRMQNLVFIPILFIFVFVKERFSFLKNKPLWITLLIFLLVMSPLIVMYTQHFGNPVVDIMSYIFGVKNPSAITIANRTFATLSMYFIDLPYNLTKPIFFLFLVGIFYFFVDLFLGFDKMLKDKNIQKKFFVFLWITVPLLFLGYLGGYPEQRYTLAQHPFFFLIAAIPLFKIGAVVKKRFSFSKKTIFTLILIAFILSSIPSIIWAKKLIENKKSSYSELKSAGEWINANSIRGDMVITNSFPQISYYSERKVATFGSCYNSPESHAPECSQEEFNAFLEDVRPKFIVLSVYQPHEQWMIDYPSERKDVWTPVKIFPENSQQPLLVIYESNFSASV